MLRIMLLLIIVSSTAFAEDWQTYKASTEGIKKVRIIGLGGRLMLTTLPSATDFVVRVRKGAQIANFSAKYSLRQQGGVLISEIQGSEDKSDWYSQATKPFPKFDIEILGPSLPTEIVWREGQVKVTKWEAPLSVSLQKGVVELLNGSGELKAYLHSGEFTVKDWKGGVKADTYNSKLAIENVVGDLWVRNFVGSSRLQQIEGHTEFQAFKGANQIIASKGHLKFSTQRGSLRVDRFDGPVRGSSEQAKVTLKLVPKGDIRVESQQGMIILDVPRASGARVNLGTKEGNFYVPSFLKMTRYPNLKVVTGRLRGPEWGSIHVRTDSGNIRLK